jgi:hypothetical protein
MLYFVYKVIPTQSINFSSPAIKTTKARMHQMNM